MIYKQNDIFPNHSIVFPCRNLETTPLLWSDKAKKKMTKGMDSQKMDTVLTLG